MKRMVGAGLILGAALAVLMVGSAHAQSPRPPTPRGAGEMGAGGGYGRTGFAGSGESGRMHEYMELALAEALGISEDEFEMRREAGETAYEIALTEGFSANEIPALLRDARVKAWDAAAADAVITQEHLEWMKSRPSYMGFGDCPGNGHGYGGMMGGWRFQQSNP